eukprot:4903065-Pyramimonas_sp.AAC.1
MPASENSRGSRGIFASAARPAPVFTLPPRWGETSRPQGAGCQRNVVTLACLKLPLVAKLDRLVGKGR